MQIADPATLEMLRGKQVLVVDDDGASRRVVRALLAGLGIDRVIEAPDGKTAIEAILASAPDLVLLDWQMPGLDGAGLLRWVRHPGVFPHCDVPIVVLTGHGERSCVTEAIRLGAHEYLLKPVSTQALLARLVAVFCHPRPMVQRGGFYGPQPRQTSILRPDAPARRDTLFLN